MNSMRDILSDVEVGVKCRKCGAVSTLVGLQYSVHCRTCGTHITALPDFLRFLKRQEYRKRYPAEDIVAKHRCNVCKDKGWGILEEQIDETLSEFGYRCFCQAGQDTKKGGVSEFVRGWPVLPIRKIKPGLNLLDIATDVTEKYNAGGGSG